MDFFLLKGEHTNSQALICMQQLVTLTRLLMYRVSFGFHFSH